MDDNVLNQLRNKRNRATVPERVDALVPKPKEEDIVQKQEILDPSPDSEQNPAQQETPISNSEASSNPDGSQTASTLKHPSRADTLASLIAELQQYPETRRHSAIVLEKDLDSQLTQFCKDRGITVETFLEAAWAVTSADNTLVEKITTEAKRRYDQRKRVGQIKRLITMLGNA